MHRWLWLALIAGSGCKHHEAAPAAQQQAQKPQRDPDVVAKTTMPIKIDGDWDEHDWPERAWRAQFVGDDGKLARPSSEIRMLHDDKDLIVALYAADENIVSTDAFDLTVGAVTMHVDARGKVSGPGADPSVRAKVGFDEGTIDDPHDDDEEWVVELAIPLARVGTPPLAVKASRCDTPKDGIERCGHWAGSVRLE